MAFIKSKKHYQDEIESGKTTLISMLLLAGLAFKVSKNKILSFIIPALFLIAMALWFAYGMMNEGESKFYSIALSMFCFCIITSCVVKALWAPIGLDFLESIETMFGPKTRSEILRDYLSGKMAEEGMNAERTARRLGEYTESLYEQSTRGK